MPLRGGPDNGSIELGRIVAKAAKSEVQKGAAAELSMTPSQFRRIKSGEFAPYGRIIKMLRAFVEKRAKHVTKAELRFVQTFRPKCQVRSCREPVEPVGLCLCGKHQRKVDAGELVRDYRPSCEVDGCFRLANRRRTRCQPCGLGALTSSPNDALSAAIEAARFDLGLTDVQLAEFLGCSRQLVYSWEKSHAAPRGWRVDALRAMISSTGRAAPTPRCSFSNCKNPTLPDTDWFYCAEHSERFHRAVSDGKVCSKKGCRLRTGSDTGLCLVCSGVMTAA